MKILAVLLFALGAAATPVVNVEGSIVNGALSGRVLAMRFDLLVPVSGASLSLWLVPAVGDSATLADIYLSQKLGPAADETAEVAKTRVTVTRLYPIWAFTALSLSAGTYYLIVDGANGVRWRTGDNVPTPWSDVAPTALVASNAAAFLPASSFSTVAPQSIVAMSLEAEAVDPEPQTFALFGVGLIAVAARKSLFARRSPSGGSQ